MSAGKAEHRPSFVYNSSVLGLKLSLDVRLMPSDWTIDRLRRWSVREQRTGHMTQIGANFVWNAGFRGWHRVAGPGPGREADRIGHLVGEAEASLSVTSYGPGGPAGPGMPCSTERVPDHVTYYL